MDFSSKKSSGKNFTGIIVVVLLHILVAYGIVTGLGKRLVPKMPDVVETKIVEEVKPPAPQDIPPPPPPPAMKAPPPPFIPPVEVNVQPPPPQQNVIAVATTTKPATTELQKPAPAAPPAPSAPAPAPTVRVPAVVDFGNCAKPDYPRSSHRNEETGVVTLWFLIGVDGRVINSKVTKSSGFRELDRAAQMGLGKCKFKPGTVDGKPEQSEMQVQYVWKLDE